MARQIGEAVEAAHGKTRAFVRGRQLMVAAWHEQDGRFEIGPERAVTAFALGSG